MEKKKSNKSFGKIPIIKGDILKLGAISVGKNGDLMFQKNRYRIFLKNPKGMPIPIGKQILIKIVKIFDKVAYAEKV